MNIFETLESVGITLFHLQIGIFTIIVAVVLAMYWKLIVIGLGMIFCVIVFAMPNKTDKQNESIETASKTPVPLEYIEDCTRITQQSVADCKKLWTENRTGQNL